MSRNKSSPNEINEAAESRVGKNIVLSTYFSRTVLEQVIIFPENFVSF